MNKKHNFSDRRFLNRGQYHSLAAVSGSLIFDEKAFKEDLNWTPFQAEFRVSNCERSIRLDIDVDNEEDFNNSIFKLQQIEEVAAGLKKELIKALPKIIDWQKRVEEDKKKDKK